MQKTRLGISVGLFGAGIYFTSLFGGYMTAIFMSGYVLMFEENGWLKRSAVKAVSLMMFFSLVTAFVDLIPSITGCISYIASMFGVDFYVGVLSDLISAITIIIDIIENILFMGLGIKALNQRTIVISVIDNLISKYMG